MKNILKPLAAVAVVGSLFLPLRLFSIEESPLANTSFVASTPIYDIYGNTIDIFKSTGSPSSSFYIYPYLKADWDAYNFSVKRKCDDRVNPKDSDVSVALNIQFITNQTKREVAEFLSKIMPEKISPHDIRHFFSVLVIYVGGEYQSTYIPDRVLKLIPESLEVDLLKRLPPDLAATHVVSSSVESVTIPISGTCNYLKAVGSGHLVKARLAAPFQQVETSYCKAIEKGAKSFGLNTFFEDWEKVFGNESYYSEADGGSMHINIPLGAGSLGALSSNTVKRATITDDRRRILSRKAFDVLMQQYKKKMETTCFSEGKSEAANKLISNLEGAIMNKLNQEFSMTLDIYKENDKYYLARTNTDRAVEKIREISNVNKMVQMKNDDSGKRDGKLSITKEGVASLEQNDELKNTDDVTWKKDNENLWIPVSMKVFVVSQSAVLSEISWDYLNMLAVGDVSRTYNLHDVSFAP